MAWNSDNPYSNYGQYGGGGMDMLYPNYTQPPLWNSFPMNNNLPANKFSGGSPFSKYGAGDPTSQLLGPYAGPTQWAGPNAHYPNWNDAPGPFANDVAMMPMGNPSMTWSPNLLPTPPVGVPAIPPESTELPILPRQGDPNWIGPDSEEAQKYHDRVKQMSEDFYRNNPEHFLSKIDSKVRQAFGMPQLGNTLNMGQGITPQTNWAGQGVTPQIQPQPIQTAVKYPDYGDANLDVRRANKAKSRPGRNAAGQQVRDRQRAARSRSMGTRARGSRGRDSGGGGTSGPTGGMGGQGWT